MENMVPQGKLKSWRVELKKTIQQMAELCDVSVRTWKAWEYEEISIPRTTAAYIALQIAWPGDICPLAPAPEDIKALRVLRKESQAKAAQSVDYGVDKWRSWESGKPMPRIVWYIYILGGVEATKQRALRLWRDQTMSKIRSKTMHKVRSSKNGI